MQTSPGDGRFPWKPLKGGPGLVSCCMLERNGMDMKAQWAGPRFTIKTLEFSFIWMALNRHLCWAFRAWHSLNNLTMRCTFLILKSADWNFEVLLMGFTWLHFNSPKCESIYVNGDADIQKHKGFLPNISITSQLKWVFNEQINNWSSIGFQLVPQTQ